MGSLPENSPRDYPDALDPSLVLTQPTEAEKRQTWSLNHGEWGGPLTLEEYMEREPFLASTPLASDGGMTHWILTEPPSSSHNSSSVLDQKRKVLASCETIRKAVLYVPAGGSEVREGYGYGIGSVYTYPEFRGRKYAARMLKDLGVVLRTWPAEQKRLQAKDGLLIQQRQDQGHGYTNGVVQVNSAVKSLSGHVKDEDRAPLKSFCSTLWSDIGKNYYASKGWPAFPSEHVEFSTLPGDVTSSSTSSTGIGIDAVLDQSRIVEMSCSPINSSRIATLCRDDEAQLRRQMIKHARETGRAAFAYAPRPDVFRWHWAREEFLSTRQFPDRSTGPSTGVVVTVTTISSSTSTLGAQQNGHHTHTNGNGNGNSNGNGVTIKVEQDEEETKAEVEEEGQLKTLRMWATWSRNYGKDAANHPENNTLYILRLVIDDGSSAFRHSFHTTPGDPDPKALQAAFREIIYGARAVAQSWDCGKVQLWNPEPLVRELVAGCGFPHKYVDREDSVPSLMWYGFEDESEVDWLANEKYCWC